MKRYSSVLNRAAALPFKGGLFGLVALAVTLGLAGCATDTMATKSPEDGTDYPGWAKAASVPFTVMSHQQSF